MDTFWLVDSYLRLLINHAYAMHNLNGSSTGKRIIYSEFQSYVQLKSFGNITVLYHLLC